MKTRLLSLFLACITVVCVFQPITAQEENNYNYNIMLVIDKSKSTRSTDPYGISISAAEMFINNAFTMSGAANFTGSNASCYIGALAFNDKTEVLSAPIDISDKNSRETLCERIREIKSKRADRTDIGNALNEAAKILKNSEKPGYKSLIVLLTDGYTDVRNKSPEQLKQELNNAIQATKDIDGEIFAVGLNANGGMSEAGKKQMWKIANETQIGEGFNPPDPGDTDATGEVNYLITKELSEIERFYTAVIANMFRIDQNPVLDEINIDKRVVVMINIYASPENDVLKDEDIKLINPDGSNVQFINATDFFGTEDYNKIDYLARNTFSIIKSGKNAQIMMILPKFGIYKLYLTEGIEYKAYMMQLDIEDLYSLECSTSVDINKCNVQCVLSETNSMPISENDYKYFNESNFNVFYEGEDTPIATYPLEFNPEILCFEGSFAADRPGNYIIEAVIGDEISSITAEATASFYAGDTQMEDVSVVSKHTKKVLYPESFYNGWDISWKVVSVEFDKEDIAAATQFDEEGITVKGLKHGNCEATVNVEDENNMQWQFHFKVNVTINWLLILLLAGGGLVIVAVAAVLVIRSRKFLSGSFSINIYNKSDGEMLAPAEPIKFPHGYSFTTYDLLKKTAKLAGTDHFNEELKELGKNKQDIKILKSKDNRISIRKVYDGKTKKTYESYFIGKDKNNDLYRYSDGSYPGETIDNLNKVKIEIIWNDSIRDSDISDMNEDEQY